jgi:hypothetical protein
MPFRSALTQLGLQYGACIESPTIVWEPGSFPLPTAARQSGQAHPPHVSVKQLALHLPSSAWKEVTWRQGVEKLYVLVSRPSACIPRTAMRGELHGLRSSERCGWNSRVNAPRRSSSSLHK